ncbi:BatA domain-containing protein [Portibacter marinus]|uniref:BatA domain-containing protein n=1 Tax=Portibacter marinus TaxID=2898660 RepID=UPI001F2968E8|nr:BatA domain-containing protein [Portibacter marinus]
MQFVFPGFLWALMLLAVPIIIHLFYFRRFKKVYFTNVRFLKEVKEETSSRNKLKNLLILLTRLLALAFLILAFAQPFFPSEDQRLQGKRAVSIYIDNSFSMSALSNDVSLLNKAKQKAQEIIAAYGEDERFQILSNDFSAAQQRLLIKEEALAQIDEVQERPEVYALSQVFNRQRQALNQEPFDSKIFYQISDFQKNVTEQFEMQDSTEQMNFIPLQSVQDINISIDSAWFATKVPMINQSNQLVIKLTNHSDEDREGIRLSVNNDNQTKPLGLKSIKARSSILDTANLTLTTSGWNTAEINIEDYPIVFDDNYKIAFEVKQNIRVLTINEGATNRFLEALFQGIQFIQSENQSASNVAYSEFDNYELIILNDLNRVSSGLSAAIDDYVGNGGNVLIFPGRNIDIANYNSFLGQINANGLQDFQEVNKSVGNLNTDEFIFQDVFESQRRNIKLPSVSGSYKLNNFQSRGEEAILTYRDGSTYLGKYTSGSGHIYICAAPLSTEVNDLVQNAEIFVPMVFKMAISSGNSGAIAYTIGSNRIVEIENEKSNADIVYRVIGEQEFIPSQVTTGSQVLLNMGDNITESGIYDIVLGDDVIRKVAFNYNKLESELDYYNTSDLTTLFGGEVNIFSNQLQSNFTQIIEEKDQGIVLWKWCIILALVFLAIEQLLLRFRNS